MLEFKKKEEEFFYHLSLCFFCLILERFINLTIVNNSMYSLPQEIEVWYIIPAVRRKLSITLAEKYKLKQKEIARILGTSEAAISQYLSKKRASELKFPETMNKDFEKACQEITKNNKKVVGEIMKLVNLSKKNGVSCCMCRKHNKGILTMCSCNPKKETK